MIEQKIFEVEAETLSDIPSLDPVTVYWEDSGNGRGKFTVTCYGCAWTVYFGAMGCDLKEFIARADISYLVNKMANNHPLKQTKKADAYLARILAAVKQSLKEQADVAAGAGLI